MISGGSHATRRFIITRIDYDSLADTVALTWRKSGAASYIAKYSTDMTDWGSDMGDGFTEALDEIPGDPDTITVTFELVDFSIDNETELFFRIEEE